MLEAFKEFRSTFSERLRSPFVGSLIITWLFYHWRILILILYNEEGITISERISKINNYVNDQGLCGLLWYPILITLGVLILYSILNGVGLIIKLGYDNWLSPYIQKWLYNKNIIEKYKYEKLKKELELLKNDIDEYKQKQLDNNEQYKKLEQGFESYKANSIEARITGNIAELFDSGSEWELISVFPDGKTNSLIFKSSHQGLSIENNKIISINKIRISSNGKIIDFKKQINNKEITCSLVKESYSYYSGMEDNVRVTYRRISDNILIISAKYFFKDNYINVKPFLDDLISREKYFFTINNETMGGDPFFGEKKTLDLQIQKDGVVQKFSIDEHSSFDMSQLKITV